jgi:hypothetical protein
LKNLNAGPIVEEDGDAGAPVELSRLRAVADRINLCSGDLANSNLMTFLFFAGLVLSVVAGALAKCAVERAVSKNRHPKCARGQCGELGWKVVRRDSDTCHAVCIKCGWISHFDAKRQQVD